jgi:hypothetical protein
VTLEQDFSEIRHALEFYESGSKGPTLEALFRIEEMLLLYMRAAIDYENQRDALSRELEEARGGHEMAAASVVKLRHELVEEGRRRASMLVPPPKRPSPLRKA